MVEIDEFVDHVPKGVLHAFAYGSAVFRQPGLYSGPDGHQPMVDYFIIVKDALEWHRKVWKWRLLVLAFKAIEPCVPKIHNMWHNIRRI
jgi:hypothetical protein